MVNAKMNERDSRVEHSMRSRRIIPAGCAYLATLYPQFAALLGLGRTGSKPGGRASGR